MAGFGHGFRMRLKAALSCSCSNNEDICISEVLRMSDFTKNHKDPANRYAENISEMTKSVQGICAGNYSDDELRFVVFCIENLAEDMNVDPIIVHDALAKESDIVDQYMIPCYETLHTQGKEYIVENLKEVMAERGIVL